MVVRSCLCIALRSSVWTSPLFKVLAARLLQAGVSRPSDSSRFEPTAKGPGRCEPTPGPSVPRPGGGVLAQTQNIPPPPPVQLLPQTSSGAHSVASCRYVLPKYVCGGRLCHVAGKSAMQSELHYVAARLQAAVLTGLLSAREGTMTSTFRAEKKARLHQKSSGCSGTLHSIRQLQIALRPSKAWIEGFSSTQRTIALALSHPQIVVQSNDPEFVTSSGAAARKLTTTG